MWIEEALAGVSAGQHALTTIGSLWCLTGYLYPPECAIQNLSTFDHIVVGGGSAGSVVASRLSENPNDSVLMMEAGGDPPIQSNAATGFSYLQNSPVDWSQTQQSQVDKVGHQCLKDNRQSICHGKMLGGGSSLNLMMYMQGHHCDFRPWGDIDESWNYENMLTYIKKAERCDDPKILNSTYGKYHGTDGPVGVTKLYSDIANTYLNIYEEMGYANVKDINGYGPLGFSPQIISHKNGLRQSTANTYLHMAKDRPNLCVLRNSMATKILINENKVAIGVQYTDANNQSFTVYARKEVIISCGPINSAHLLMLSRIGPKEHLEEHGIAPIADLPVGSKLVVHVGPFMIYVTDKDCIYNQTEEPNCSEPIEGLQPRPSPYDYPFNIITATSSLNKSATCPTHFIATVPADAETTALGLCSILFGFDNKTSQTVYEECKGKDTLFAAVVDCKSVNRGNVTLKSASPSDPPNVHIEQYPDKPAYDALVQYVQDFGRIVNTTAFQKCNGRLIDLPQCMQYEKYSREHLDCYMKCMTGSYYHYIGTCAMGSVVGPDLKVYGIEHLRVIDSGVLPTITCGTTNAPAIMVGEKGADLIKKAHQESN